MTDNGANIKKAISLINDIVWLACLAHMLQLSILKSLKLISQLMKRAQNLIFFFSKSPKQPECLENVQEKYHCSIELPIVTEELYDLVKAASYLSLQEYWDVPEEIGLIEECHQPLAKEIPKNYGFAKLSSMLAFNPSITNDLVLDLYYNEELDDAYEEISLIIIFVNPFKKEIVIH
ncbi:45024_t:CDS:2 [Gigaspora margarita]|uniref:45024_t:CDS:1 n=1 Tax=Gigaspora margarita TaxID=4874 RepID=A0ABN7UDV3_GIGMA|nr:45024_t:CDS:2 [Gigaspora margarita]